MDCAPFSAAAPESPAGSLTPALLDALLIAVAPEASYPLWQGLTRAVEGALWLWESSPAGSRREPPPLALQHVGLPHFNPRDLCQQTLEGIHRLLRLELPLAVDVLEALLCGKNEDAYQVLLAEQCTRVGQLYAELKRRAGKVFALLIFQWELRLLRYRASSVVAPMIFSWGCCVPASAA